MKTARAAMAILVLAGAAGTAAADPATDYLLHCRGCHLPDGTSVPPEVPTLRDEIGRIIATQAGRDYVIRVPGVAQSSLNDQRLAAVLNWVLTEFNAATLPDDFKPFSANEVGSARKNILADPLRYRRAVWRDH
jgi:hypothetical protein